MLDFSLGGSIKTPIMSIWCHLFFFFNYVFSLFLFYTLNFKDLCKIIISSYQLRQ